jgi:hypothetical protein
VNDDRESRSQTHVTRSRLGATIAGVIATGTALLTIGLGLYEILAAQPPPPPPAPDARTAPEDTLENLTIPPAEAPETTASAPAPETTAERTAEPGQQGPPSGQGSASGGDTADLGSEGPESVKSSTCLLAAKPSDPRISTAESAELIVDLSVPSHARECHDTVTIDAPTFSMGKEPEQTVSVVPPPKSDAQHWLLEPEKVGVWKIAVETKEERDIVSLIVTTPLGFSAIWVQAGVIAAGVTTLLLGALAIILRRG